MQVEFNNLKKQWAEIGTEVEGRIKDILENASYILGREVSEFEREFSNFIGVKYSVGCASGLDALKLSLRALNIGNGDEVLVPANTFIATALAVTSVGAKPVLVDCEENYYNVDVNKIEEAISAKTKAIIPVHLYGHPASMDKIIDIAKKYNLAIIEDASQAHGAEYRSKKVGSFGVLSAFSLYPGKNLGACGDAGIITTNDEAIYKKLVSIRNYGSSEKYYHEILGENSRLDNLQATILRAKLSKLDKWNNNRFIASEIYGAELAGIGDLMLPKTLSDAKHVFHLYVIQTQFRDELMEYLNGRSITCLIHYPVPIHKQKAYEGVFQADLEIPVTNKISKRILSLPMHGHITSDEVRYVCKEIKNFFKNRP